MFFISKPRYFQFIKTPVMSFIAKLKMDDEEMTVLHCSYRISQSIDATGRPSSIPAGGTINIVVESTGSASLFDFMVNPTSTKNGIITFHRRDMMSKLKTLEFTEAYCIDYYEVFNHDTNSPMQVHFTLSAKTLKLNDSEFKNNRPD